MAAKVHVKWGKSKFEVELNLDDKPTALKSTLFKLSGVPPDRQTLMIGGIKIGDEEWGKARDKLKPNTTLMMMGSAETLPEAPIQQVKFVEDMSENEKAAGLGLPTGLDNLGNTCYINATLQCLRAVPELREVLKDYPNSERGIQISQILATRLKHLYGSMDAGAAGIIVKGNFEYILHEAVPHFGERDEKTGSFRQQDAHECWSAVVSNLAESLVNRGTVTPVGQSTSFIDRYFSLQLQTKYKCEDSASEPETQEVEKSYQLSCFISQDVKYLHTGLLKVWFDVCWHGKDARYSKKSSVSRLPAYLTIQFVRFFVGKAGDSEEVVPKKILKDVKFPMKLDVYEMCSTSLQEKLLPMRQKFKQVEDQKLIQKAKEITEGATLGLRQQHVAETKVEYEPFSFPDDPGSSNSGFYELLAVLTHQGRSSSSGHYLGWVRRKNGDWIKLDDDVVSAVPEEEVLKLSGGGDWHTAYILLYGPRKLEKLKECSVDSPSSMDI
ncbi:hypothetical protein EMCRGX_G034164 [Ephydatia muelleri]